ncbi:MAG: DNA repair protein RecN, partial [Candidatus Eremiobacteraeota bacterium]|nr:DNA repair protein RecN [Candidatus Eremiobacteraeota bacterium]
KCSGGFPSRVLAGNSLDDMLRRLEIENYGLIARARIEFARGATIFTGETGSGKTMLLGAIGFALGARAGADAVRRGASRAVVRLVFDAEEAFRARMAADGYELDPGEEATIEREMNDGGRSGIRVNGRASTAGYVRDIAENVAEIVGQHEAQRLLSPAYHGDLLDRYAGDGAVAARAAVEAAYSRLADARAALESMGEDEARARRAYDDACFALREIEETRLEQGEAERLTERRRYLDNVERIAGSLRRASEALAAEERGAAGGLGEASVALAGIAEIGAEFASMSEQAAALQSEANDLAARVARAAETAEFDPAELDSINARLDVIARLHRKYGESVEAVRLVAANARATIDAYEGRDRRTAELSANVAAAGRDLGIAAVKLTQLRKTAATKLARAVAAEFGDLALGSARFEATLVPLERIGPDGAERVEFLFAANAGEPVRPLAKVASGGELSRVLLALVVVLAANRELEGALVFDEIDAGIGGATATAVGARIGRLAKHAQVLSVTHLAQLATWADRHYVLEKAESGGETTISVREIAQTSQREQELARMLSGETHEAALQHARQLLLRVDG